MFGWALNVITRSLIGGVTTERRCYSAGFEDGGKGHEPRNAALGAGEDKDVFSPRASGGSMAVPTP